jgi:hypothetical protein
MNFGQQKPNTSDMLKMLLVGSTSDLLPKMASRYMLEHASTIQQEIIAKIINIAI